MKKFPFYVFLFSLYPVLALWEENIQEVAFSQVLRALLSSLLLGGMFLSIAYLMIRDVRKAGLIAAVALVMFFSYGHIYDSIRTVSFDLARHRYLLPLLGLGFFLWVFYMIKARDTTNFSQYFSLFGIVLLLIPLYTIFNFKIKEYSVNRENSSAPVANLVSSQKRPDIYYIIVDGYGRQDILAKYYKFDNSEFINFLEAKGFYVAKESRSNYRKTILSLTSSLNMDYIQHLFPNLDPKSKDYTELLKRLRHSAVRQFLHEQGYRFVTVNNGIKTTIGDADVLLEPSKEYLSEEVDLSEAGSVVDLNSFEGLFIRTSLARLWVDWQVHQGKSDMLDLIAVEAPYNRHRQYIRFAINSIAETAGMVGDNFIFIHILAPHPPFVFGPNGEQLRHTQLYSIADGPYSQGSKEDYVRGYTGQVAFLDEQLMSVIDYLLEHSETPPIIILQGDHGPKGFTDENSETGDFTENFANLNAYYFPDQDYSKLYPSITPVNSFRILFNKFFGADFPLLENESYFSDVAHPFDFKIVTGQVK